MLNNKIVLINNRNYSVIKFRKNLIESLKKEGYQVFLIIIDNSEEKIEIKDVEIYYIPENNRSINPIGKFKMFMQIVSIIKKIKPNKVFTFQVSPNIFGVLAAKVCKVVDIYSMVEGAGDVFIYNSLKWKIIRCFTCLLYKEAFKFCKRILFLNSEDKEEFINRKLVNKKQCAIIHGIGVDTDYFSYVPIFNTNTFLMIARMMPAKGTIEYCEAARIVKKKYPKTVFNYIGEEFILTRNDIKEYIDDGTINYLGWQNDVRPFLNECYSCLSLSKREGLSMTLMEAASIGRASIVTNIAGNREIVTDNYNGYIIEDRDPKTIANKIILALNNTEKMIQMGRNSRELAVKTFNVDVINKEIIDIIK